VLIDHVRSRRAGGAGPATVMNDLVWIGVVLRAAKNVKELPVRPEITQEASRACRELRLIGKPRRRARRPTADELARLREYFVGRDRRVQIPMQAIVDFAIASARREAEIRRLEWRDNDTITRTGVVRDAKHPTSKDGNHRRFKYTPEAWTIVGGRPRTSAHIFPYDPKSVGATFTRACHVRAADSRKGQYQVSDEFERKLDKGRLAAELEHSLLLAGNYPLQASRNALIVGRHRWHSARLGRIAVRLNGRCRQHLFDEPLQQC
jgi:integrase